ncbi:hypothetical protein LEM8419_03387 [Neolewinella maritima]|uniref:Lipoprotein n=1 Tax=Neolewinella maritima TaxID=1383882 RepID=A0ABM9B5C1_9BACT|nr:hypothetical protein [Neolewinella maritima]CAH1002508.1 hypothetical protein LEM8419_03387 [Neolewinella maritima]
MTDPRLFSLLLLVFTLTFATGCGGDDEDDGDGNPCQVELVSVTEFGDDDFTVTLRNSSAQTVSYSIAVRYLDADVQQSFNGIGGVQNVDPGTTVEIETVSGGGFTEDDYDCAQIILTIIPQSGTVLCNEGQIGADCY